jgi:hypothetical protein
VSVVRNFEWHKEILDIFSLHDFNSVIFALAFYVGRVLEEGDLGSVFEDRLQKG